MAADQKSGFLGGGSDIAGKSTFSSSDDSTSISAGSVVSAFIFADSEIGGSLVVGTDSTSDAARVAGGATVSTSSLISSTTGSISCTSACAATAYFTAVSTISLRRCKAERSCSANARGLSEKGSKTPSPCWLLRMGMATTEETPNWRQAS